MLSKFHFPLISAKVKKKFGETKFKQGFKSQQRYDESFSFLCIVMKSQKFRALRGRGKLHLDESRTVQRIVFFL